MSNKFYLSMDEISLLYKGINEEINNNVQIHKCPENETKRNLTKYVEAVNRENKHDIELFAEVCREILIYWKNYFTKSPEEAERIQREYDRMILERLQTRLEEIKVY